MPKDRLAVSVIVMAMFTYGIVSFVAGAAPAAVESSKRSTKNCPVEKQIADGGCACGAQINRPGAPCAPAPAIVPRRIGTIMLGRQPHSDNCVFYARARVPSLPYGLGTWMGKLAIINAHTPQPGDVAIIHIGSGVYKDVGHVAIVEQVTDSTITILEGNFYAGHVSRRTATGADAREAASLMGIVGYFRTSGKSADPTKTRSHTKQLANRESPAH
jgi:hypothetical protein